jgi:sterol desaturase/sphingolipid hydroxylase (fatty acid hydroxylase superfamily)
MEPAQLAPAATTADRHPDSGWISGVLAVTLALMGIGAVLCLRYPEFLTVPEAREVYDVGLIRLLLQLVLVTGFALAIVSIVLRKRKILGFTAIAIILIATLLGGSQAQRRFELESDVYLGLDWFLLNLIFTGIVFVPVERLLGVKDQSIFRFEWRLDLFYFFISTLLVQMLVFLTLVPSLTILKHTDLSGIRGWIASQPVVLQVVEIMFLTDLVQYWLHRLFHRVPFLWKFHALHHSAQVMDWLATARFHLVEIVIQRSLTVIPMYVLGFGAPALYAYLIIVFFLSSGLHANIRLNLDFLHNWIVIPRFHHWHHAIEKEAIDVNFAAHFPLLDRVFRTYYLPAEGRWPSGYGIAGPVPSGFFRQFLYPFSSSKRISEHPEGSS